jgi:hypothetical protein
VTHRTQLYTANGTAVSFLNLTMGDGGEGAALLTSSSVPMDGAAHVSMFRGDFANLWVTGAPGPFARVSISGSRSSSEGVCVSRSADVARAQALAA